MQAEVIAIGDELTSGERLDTNSCWLSQRLAEIGVSVMFHSTVGDDLASCTEVIRRATERAEIVIVTGGLGPTADDLTRDAIAGASGRRLLEDAATVEKIADMFRRRGREMPKQNRVQAMFPEGSTKIHNPHGTAPGIEITMERRGLAGDDDKGNANTSHLFALPGVPAEMKPMWTATVAARVRELAPAAAMIRHRELKCFGVGESQLEAMLPDLIRRGREPVVGITVHAATITLRVSARGEDEEAIAEVMRPTVETIRECLGSLVFGEGNDELQHVVTRLLNDAGQTLATAECATGGLVASWLADVPSSDNVFSGGEIHARESFGQGDCVADVVRKRAIDVRSRFDADFGLAIGPLPAIDDTVTVGSDSDATETRNAEQYYMALADGDGCHLHVGRSLAHPAIRKELAGKQALDRLRLRLLGGQSEPS